MTPSWSRWAILAAAGGLVCTGCDHLHVVFGVLYYPHPSFAAQAWWVFPLFAVSSVVLAASVAPFEKLGGAMGPPGRTSAPSLAKGIAVSGRAFVVAYALTAVLHASPNLVLAVLVASWLVRLRFGGSRGLILFALLTALSGPLVEAAISGLGLFFYRDPDWLGFPRWLPALYLHVGLLAPRVARAVSP